jgi:hypothetical protein
MKKSEHGIEAFGFATGNDHPSMTNKLLNELPLLNRFISYFKDENAPLLNLVAFITNSNRA